jgi:PleD family two-component response regulator
MARARHISIQFKADPEKQSGSSTMLVADRVERDSEPSVRGEPESPVVLVVDDDAELRESLVRLLAECDLTAVGAASSLDALNILERSRVDVVVSDHFIWGIDGVGCSAQFETAGPTCSAFCLRQTRRPTSSSMRSTEPAFTRCS